MSTTVNTNEVKDLLINTFSLEITRDDIPDDMGIIGDGLELDSIDALEIIYAMEKQYGIKLKQNEIGKNAFENIQSLTSFIQSKIQ